MTIKALSLGSVLSLLTLMLFEFPIQSVADPFDVLIEFPSRKLALMDLMAHPCEDFYQYACGRWLKDDKLDVLPTYSSLDDKIWNVLKSIVEGDTPVVSVLYQSCMDVETLDARGAEPLQGDLARIRATETTEDVFKLAADLTTRTGICFVACFDIVPDATNNASAHAIHLGLQTLTLGYEVYNDADMWTKVGPEFEEYVFTLLKLAGLTANDAAAATTATLYIEHELALGQLARPPSGNLVESTVGDVSDVYPQTVGWMLERTVGPVTLSGEIRVVHVAEELHRHAEKLISDLDVTHLRWYLMYVLVKETSPFLSKPFVDAQDKLFGTNRGPRRWKWCLNHVQETLPQRLGTQFFRNVHGEDAMSAAQIMIAMMEKAMEATILNATWLDDDTRVRALRKLAAMNNLVGHSHHEELIDVALSSHDFLGNVQRIRRSRVQKMLNKLHERVDRIDWDLPAFEANAWYTPNTNTMTLPIGILQDPLFHVNHTPAENFGALGSIIGHEVTHGFDSKGRRYDGEGRLHEWWSEQADHEFNARAKCMEQQYSSFGVRGVNGTIIAYTNGSSTLAENIADNGGLALALNAYHDYLRAIPQATEGLVEENDRLFFVSFAQNYCWKETDEEQLDIVATDNHAPKAWRVNGALMNSEAFAHAFQCDAGQRMNPTTKCKIW
ncbi:TPA: hypothetical protein N0F65_011155 [Lagenidium giganteum]|uniref:Endothelin-converting enzyme 1 n=1 Tax=Lagenidium giganteum TaxID=4803 RepID=A0AAV2ZA10_9STRA|nr:TPA: hypothetical protein N0F65_011155 [Lagenidium giganteum]